MKFLIIFVAIILIPFSSYTQTPIKLTFFRVLKVKGLVSNLKNGKLLKERSIFSSMKDLYFKESSARVLVEDQNKNKYLVYPPSKLTSSSIPNLGRDSIPRLPRMKPIRKSNGGTRLEIDDLENSLKDNPFTSPAILFDPSKNYINPQINKFDPIIPNNIELDKVLNNVDSKSK